MLLRDVFDKLDKASTKWSGYFDVYDRHLLRFIGRSPRILEVGILGGGSLEMWKKYFGAGTKVFGVDADPNCSHYADENVSIFLGDQGDPLFWETFFADNGTFDIMIDDGGHQMQQQVTTLESAFPFLNDGGIYVTEDTHTSYWDQWGGSFRGATTFMNYAKGLTDLVNRQHFDKSNIENWKPYEDLYGVSFYNSMVVIEKRKVPPFEIVESNPETVYYNVL